MITGMAHTCFTVSNLDKALSFHRDGLGLKEAFDFVNEDGYRFGVYLYVGERNFIELFEGTLEERVEGQSFKHICLEVDDIEATVSTLRTRGVEVSPIKLGKDNSYQAWITDPDGNRMELHGYTAESWQAPSLS